MHSFFYFSFEIKDFLFRNVSVNSMWGMISLCLGVAGLSVLAEVLKSGHNICFRPMFHVIIQPKFINDCGSGDSSVATDNRTSGIRKLLWQFSDVRNGAQRRILHRISGTTLYIIIMNLNYILMLSVMTFNGYIAIAIICGSGIGYFCFNFLNIYPYINHSTLQSEESSCTISSKLEEAKTLVDESSNCCDSLKEDICTEVDNSNLVLQQEQCLISERNPRDLTPSSSSFTLQVHAEIHNTNQLSSL